jgi:hypothetical protein
MLNKPKSAFPNISYQTVTNIHILFLGREEKKKRVQTPEWKYHELYGNGNCNALREIQRVSIHGAYFQGNSTLIVK